MSERQPTAERAQSSVWTQTGLDELAPTLLRLRWPTNSYNWPFSQCIIKLCCIKHLDIYRHLFCKTDGSDLFTFWLSGWKFGCHLIKNFITWHSPVFIRYKQMLSLKRFSLVHIKKARKTPRCLSVWLLRCVFSVYLFEVLCSPSLLSKRPLPELKVKSVWLDLTAAPGSPWLPTQVYQTCPWPSFLLLQKHIKCRAFQHRLKQALEKGPKKRY